MKRKSITDRLSFCIKCVSTFFILGLLVLSCSQKMSVTESMNGTDISNRLRALLSQATSGEHIRVPAGSYFVEGDFHVKDGVHLEGRGSNSTRLESRTGTTFYVVNVSNVTVSGFWLGSKNGHSSVSVASGGSREKVTAKPVTNIRITDVEIDNTASLSDWKKGRHGISVRARADEDVTGVTIKSCKVTGASGGSSFTGLDNCYIASYDGAGKGQVREVIVEDCFFSDSGRQNLSVAGKGKSKPAGISILNSYFYNSALAGIDLEEASDVVIDGCSFRQNGNNQKYFIHEKKNSSMRSGLVAHNTNAVVRNSKFEDCFYGYSSVNTQGEGMIIENCTFLNAPLDNGSFAGMSKTQYEGCQFSGERRLVDFYNASFRFDDCVFSSSNSVDPMITIGGGGMERRSVGEGLFNNCTFTGEAGPAFELNYETIKFRGCSFNNFTDIITVGGSNRSNSLDFSDCSFTNVGSLGTMTGNSIEELSLTESRGEFTRNLITSMSRNGDFVFTGNTLMLSDRSATELGRYNSLRFTGNILSPPDAGIGSQKANRLRDFLVITGPHKGSSRSAPTIVTDNVSGDKDIKVSNFKQ